MPSTATIIIYIVVFLVFLLIVFGSYTLMRIADRLNIKGYWLAMLPIAQAYVFGKVIRKIDFGGYEINHAEIILLVWPFTLLGTFFLPSGSLFYGYFINNEPSTFWQLVQALLIFLHVLIYLYGLNTFFLMFTHSNFKSRLYTFVGGITIVLIPLFMLLVRNTAPIGWVNDTNTSKRKNKKSAIQSGKIKNRKNKGINKAKKKR